MEKRRTPFAIAIAAVSLGLLAACSDEADRASDAPAEQVMPAPGAPADPMSSPQTPAPAPDTGTTAPSPAEPSAPPAGSNPAEVPPIEPVPETAPSS